MITGVALAAVATGAFAQTSAPAGEQEVVVTGSRIPQPNLTSVSPITGVTAQEFKQSGVTDTVDALNQLPQVNPGLNNTPNPLSGSGGFTTVDLRALGPTRTLVLEDGKRLMPGDPVTAGVADLDTIPSALIDRVEVVTGGASAVYGSDAVAGAVNFIMKHNFQGVQLDVQLGVNEHDNNDSQMQALSHTGAGVGSPSGTIWDGKTYNFSAIFGSNTADGKGNATAYVGYRDQIPVYQSARDYSACQLSQASGTPACVGSSNSNYFYDNNSGITYSVTGSGAGNIFTTTRNQLTTPPKSFQANTFETLSRGDERYQAGYFAHYQVASWADVYSDFSFMDDRSVVHAAPSALFKQVYQVNCNNPFLSAQQVNAICTSDGIPSSGMASLTIGRRDVEGGGRIYSFEHLSYKADVGVRGDIFDGAWHYDVSGQYGRTQYNYSVQNDISISKAQNALLVGGTAANPVCLSGGSCVPYNIFSNGGVTQAALGYILTSGTSTGYTEEQIVNANITGELGKYGVKSPLAKDGVGVNFGVEYRREALAQVPDETSLSGDLSGAGGAAPPVMGAFDVSEAFTEVRVPLIQDATMVKDLFFEGGYRTSQYNLAGNTSAYKLALNYQPVSEIRFRAAFERAVRAPNVNELYTPDEITNTSVIATDPCSGQNNVGGHATATLAQCLHTVGPNINAAQLTALYGNGIDIGTPGGTDRIQDCTASQCGTVYGGNTKLTPEIGRTFTYGVVFTPSNYISGLNVSVDYFKIELDNAVGTFPINIAFSDCLNSGTHCDTVVRTAQGSIFGTNLLAGGYVSGTNVNIGSEKTEGVDIAANYHFDLDKIGLTGLGRIAIKYDGTYTKNFILSYPQVGSYDCAGLYGNTCGTPLPKWKQQMRVTWTTPWQVSVSGQWRYIGATSLDNNQSNPLLYAGSYDALDAHIPGYSYFDLSGTWTVGHGLTVRGGINNLFDKTPPVLSSSVTGSGTPNSYATYDLLGRMLFLGLTAKF